MLDLIPGASVDELIQVEKELPEPLVRSIGASIARALSSLHAAGWVHGDVKPANIRLDSSGRAILVDLGFARRTGSGGAPLGTPGYLAPERTTGGPPRASADLFALGVTLYELLTGEHPAGPLSGTSTDPATEARLKALRRGRIKPPSDVTPRVSPLLDALVRSLLEPNPGTRPTASEVAGILTEGEAGEWWLARITFDASVRRDTVAWSGQHGIPLVGREDELDALDVAWAQARSGGLSVLLSGEQGSGKSRLIAEFAHRVRHSDREAPLYLYARCDSVGDARPGAPLISLLRRWLHLPSPGVPGKRAMELLGKTVAPDTARALEHALQPGAEDAPAIDIAESAALAEWLIHLGKEVPSIIFLDDINFAGKSTLGALARVARELEGSRMLLILGLRRRAEVRHPAELAELHGRLAGQTTRINLGPLDETAILTLVEHIFHHSVPRLRLARTLLDRTQGLPGSIGELLRLARRRGWTRPSPAPGIGLQLLVSPEELPRPESLRKAVGERLDDLEPRSRVWLERLAILGARIDPELLALAWPKACASSRDAAISGLVRNGWLVAAGSRYRFAHPVDREETLNRVPARRQRRAHAALGTALSAQESTRGRRPSYRRAFHLRGAELLNELLTILPSLLDDLRDRGHPYRRATVAGWGLEAIDDGATVPDLTRLRRRLLEELADAADRLGEREEQRAALDELSALDIDVDEDPSAAGRIYLLHARHAVSSGQFGLARGLLRNARQLMEKPSRAALSEADARQQSFDRAEIERLAARIEAEHSEFRQASKYASKALDLAPDPVSRAEAHLLRAEIEILDGSVESALKRLSHARREIRSEEGGLRARSTRASISLVTGRAWRLVGRPYRAARAFERATELAVKAGEGRIEVEVAARHGRLLADVGREHESELILRDALFSARRIEDKRGEALAALFLGILLGEKGVSGAADLIRRATALAEELGQGRIEALSAAIEGRIAFGMDDIKLALERSAHGWDLVRRHGAELPDRIVIGGTRALTLRIAGRAREAVRMEKSIARRIDSDNAQLESGVMQQRHHRWSFSLLESALDTDGPLYPRVFLEDTRP
ncbi:MAG: tetratricopeptide (TPR) repeat protein [Planctomycetota bacterium]|jgi:tetratricopeptide (TPR) repeat protein